MNNAVIPPTHFSHRIWGAFALLLTTSLLPGCGDALSQAKSDFVNGCKRSGGTTALCECTWGGLQERYSPEQLQKVSQSRQLPAGFMDTLQHAAQQCAR